MAKVKLGTIAKFKPKTKKKGSAFKQSGPKATPTKLSVGQGKRR
jgi:hypothetical protein